VPNIDQDVSSVDIPWAILWKPFGAFPLGPADNAISGFTLTSGYPALPCRLFRSSTDRNVSFRGKKYSSNFRQRLFEWYSRKPPPVRLAGKDKTLRKELLTDKADWRRSRPVRVNPKRDKFFVPPGWELIELPNGNFRIKSKGYDPRSELSRFEWVPELRRSLRPINRKWTRHSRHLPVDAKVNDLEFFHQTGGTNGLSIGGVFKDTPSGYPVWSWTSNPNWLGYVLGTGDCCFFPFSELGYSSDPIPALAGVWDSRLSTDQAALLARNQDKTAELSIIALRRHYQKLANQKVDLATELSQGMKTVNQMADIAKRIATALTNLKKGRVLAAFKVLFPTTPKGAANDFLAWKYGIKPLIGDLQGAAMSLAEYILRSSPLKSNGHAKTTFKESEEHFLTSNSPAPGLPRSAVRINREVTIRVKYGTSFVIPDRLRRQAATLGFTNPKNVAWELLPLSFVIDWFLPIGHWLNSLSALDGLVLKESYKTVFIVETMTQSMDLYGHDGVTPTQKPLTGVFGSGRGDEGFLHWFRLQSVVTRKTVYCKREVISLPDVPIPKLKNPISKGHIESAVALFTQLSK